MIKDILEVVLNTAGEITQSYLKKRFPDKSTDAEKRRLVIVITVGFLIGAVVIVVVIMIA